MSGPLHTVHVRVNDAATGQPTPVRLRITGTDGTYYPPLGRLAQLSAHDGDNEGNVQLGGELWAYIDGSCEIRLPAGTLIVHIHKGPEYRPLRTEVTLPPGKLALRFTIERWTDLRAEGWYAGDASVYGLSPHAALLEGAAEDVAVVNLLTHRLIQGTTMAIAGTRHLTAFSGQKPALEKPGHLVIVNTLNSHAMFGRLALLNCHRLVFPLTFGAPDGPEDWTLADWCDQCHRKGGFVVWQRGGVGQPETGEALADLLLGKIDALDDFPDTRARRREYYRLLDCNVRVPLAVGSGKTSASTRVGAARTYARLLPNETFTYAAWIEAVRAGRTFVTKGPLLDFTIDGQGPGACVEIGGKVHVKATARSIVPFERLELVINGEAVAAVEASGAPFTAVIEGDIDIATSGWLAARCGGVDLCAAHTSPIYVHVADRPHDPHPINVAHLIDQLNQMRNWAEHGALYENDKQRDQMLGIFDAACAALVAKMTSVQ